MSRILIAVALMTTVAAFNAEAQSRLGNAKNTGAYRTKAYQQSGRLKVQPTGGQRHNNVANSGAFYFSPSAHIYSKRKSGGSRIRINRKIIKN